MIQLIRDNDTPPKAVYKNVPARDKVVAPGQKACSKCRGVKAGAEFERMPNRVDGRTYAVCKKCYAQMDAKKAGQT